MKSERHDFLDIASRPPGTRSTMLPLMRRNMLTQSDAPGSGIAVLLHTSASLSKYSRLALENSPELTLKVGDLHTRAFIRTFPSDAFLSNRD